VATAIPVTTTRRGWIGAGNPGHGCGVERRPSRWAPGGKPVEARPDREGRPIATGSSQITTGDLVDPRRTHRLDHLTARGDRAEKGRLSVVALERILEQIGALAWGEIVEASLSHPPQVDGALEIALEGLPDRAPDGGIVRSDEGVEHEGHLPPAGMAVPHPGVSIGGEFLAEIVDPLKQQREHVEPVGPPLTSAPARPSR
jgi:hypothetical protein